MPPRISLADDIDAFATWLVAQKYAASSINSYRSRLTTIQQHLTEWPPSVAVLVSIISDMPLSTQASAGPAWNLYARFAAEVRQEALPSIPRHGARKDVSPEALFDPVPDNVALILYRLHEEGRRAERRGKPLNLFSADALIDLRWKHVDIDSDRDVGVIKIMIERMQHVLHGPVNLGDREDGTASTWLLRFADLYAWTQGHSITEVALRERATSRGGYDPEVPLVPLRARAHEPSPRWRMREALRQGKELALQSAAPLAGERTKGPMPSTPYAPVLRPSKSPGSR